MPRSFVGARSFFRDPVAYVRAHANGDAALRLTGPGRAVLVLDPDEIWRVLVSDAGSFRQGKWKRRARRFLGPTLNMLDGDEHRRRRALVQPPLDRRRVARFAPAIAARAERMQARWRDGERVVLRDELDPLSLAMAGDVLLSVDLEPESRRLAAALGEVMSGVPRLAGPLRGTRQARALAVVEAAVTAVAAARRRSADPGDDLVGALVASGLPEETVRGELVAFLLAAVDEPPSGLAAAWYLLGLHPEADDRLARELAALRGRVVTLDDDLPFLDAVIRESLRLYPPARYVDRCPVHDVELGGRRVPAGANVLLSPLVTHREPSLYARPESFEPERWLERAERPRGSYVPFGAGAHTCIGEPLARAIMTLTLASVARRWCLRLDPDPPAPVPRAPKLHVTLERR